MWKCKKEEYGRRRVTAEKLLKEETEKRHMKETRLKWVTYK